MNDSLTPSPAHEKAGPASLAAGRYLLIRKLAEGGTAAVHLGWDCEAREWRAIKTLLPEYAARASLRHRFEVEARTMSMLEHPAIVKVYDAGIDHHTVPDETAYMVMEFAEGGSVIDWVERFGPMPARLAVDVTIALCEAIHAAHQAGVIHRDIKPQNLLIATDGTCKVTDFGIAQVVEETRLTMTGTVMGTVGYMAPEQHESAKHIDARADIYSIAATLFTLARGQAATHLFMADAEDFKGIAAPLVPIIQRGAQYRKEARYPDVSSMFEALQQARRALPEPPADTPSLLAARALCLADLPKPTLAATATPAPARPSAAPSGPPDGSIEPAPSATARPAHDSADSTTTASVRPSWKTESGHFREARPYGYDVELAERRRQRNFVAVLLTILLLFFSVSALWVQRQGATMIADAEGRATEARVLFYEAILNEWGVVGELEALGVDTTEVSTLLDEIDRTTDDDLRYGAAGRLHNLLTQHLRHARREASPTKPHIVRALEARCERLERAAEKERAASHLVRSVRESTPGRVATFFGS